MPADLQELSPEKSSDRSTAAPESPTPSTSSPERVEALLRFRGYGNFMLPEQDVREAVVLLTDCDEYIRQASVKAFNKMGATAAEQVASQLEHPEPSVRATTVELLAAMGKLGAAHVQAISRCLHDSDQRVRRCAASALGTFGQLGQERASEIAMLLNDEDTDVRRLAVETMGKMGKPGHEYVKACVHLLDDPQWTVRRSAVVAVGSMGEAAEAYTDMIAELLDDTEWMVRGAASEALGRLGEASTKHVDAIQDLLMDREWFVRNAAAEALYNIGRVGRQRLEIYHEGMRSPAAEELATRFDPSRAPAVSELLPPERPKTVGGKPKKSERRTDRRTAAPTLKAAVAQTGTLLEGLEGPRPSWMS